MSGFADRASVPSENVVLEQLQRLQDALARARETKAAEAKLSETIRGRLLRALKAGIPLDEALLHAGLGDGAYRNALVADSGLEGDVLAARKYPISLARAVIRREMTSDWRLAEKILLQDAQESELERLRALTTDPVAA